MTETEKHQQARKTREAETASTDWYAAVDTRIRTHFKDWAWAAIDERIQQWWKAEIEPLKDGIGGALGKIRAQLRGEFKCAIEEQQRSFETQLAEPKERLLALTNSAGEAQTQLRDEVKRAIEETVDAFGAEITALERRLRTVPGKLPVAKVWCPETVTYQAEFVCHEGALWQACKDTAQTPGVGSDFVCVARAGRDGLTPNIRGAFDVYKKYAQFDIVTFDGSSFVAKRNNPGICPGSGWEALVPRGKAGDRGPPGPRGAKGEKGAKGDSSEIVSWHLERATYRAFPVFADGKMGPELNLRPLFEQFVEETSRAAE